MATAVQVSSQAPVISAAIQNNTPPELSSQPQPQPQRPPQPVTNPQSVLSPTDGYTSSFDDDDHQSTTVQEESISPGAVQTLDDATDEGRLCAALGILPIRGGDAGVVPVTTSSMTKHNVNGDYWVKQDADAESGLGGVSKYYDVVPNPDADEVDLSVLRGTRNPKISAKEQMANVNNEEGSDDLTALGELLPTLVDDSHKTLNANYGYDKEPSEKTMELVQPTTTRKRDSTTPVRGSLPNESPALKAVDSMLVNRGDSELVKDNTLNIMDSLTENKNKPQEPDLRSKSSDSSITAMKQEEDITNHDPSNNNPDNAKNSQVSNSSDEQDFSGFETNNNKSPAKSRNIKTEPSRRPVRDASTRAGRYSSVASISSATVSTHEVRMPMYLPTFKPATGCTNASDFIVRCFVARLRSGITVVKHGRSRWCKSRLRLLHVHQDGRSLSWKPALGEPTSSKRPPKLDLSTCMEVRHAWSPDPLYPMFTGTPILRQKCEAANAHKSFALIFPKRTVDVTAVTADQCKVLMEGFSALCFRLQVANLAGRGKNNTKGEETSSDAEKTTNSNTLTDNSGGGGGTSPTDASSVKRSSYR